MKNPQRDVPFTILRAMGTSILLYGSPILGIVCVVPGDQIQGVSGFLDAVAQVFTVYGGAADFMLNLMAFTFIMALISSGSSWLMGADRTEAIASIDGTGPTWLGRFSSRFGTPVNVNFASGVVSTVVFVIAEFIGDGNTSVAFDIMIGIVLLFTNLSYLVIFPSLVKLRKSHPNAHRPYRVPGGMAGAWFVAIITTFWSAFASLTGIFPGLLSNGMLLDDSALPEGVSRLQFTTYVGMSIGVTLAVGIVFYIMGGATRRQLVSDPEVPKG
jgi:amino acid transporter